MPPRPKRQRHDNGMCIQCDKILSVSHLTSYSAATQSGICRTCVRRNAATKAAKTCNQCAQPLHPNATPGTWCLKCAYPPCTCGQPRPQKGKLHAKQVPIWRCETCRKKCSSCGDALAKTNTTSTLCPTCSYPPCLGCGCPRPDSKEYHVAVMPNWTCAVCVVKPCSQCGQPLNNHASTDTWCKTCSFPPCSTCGCPRPESKQYHVKVMPSWTCAVCAMKPCSQCGQPLNHRAATDTWCKTCSFPPCISCGCPRPESKEYHGKVMPSWTCAVCAVKPCSQCGQPINNRAAGDTWCQACAFPPCPDCGAPRPHHHKEYHASIMPIWACATCTTKKCVACGKPLGSHVKADAMCEACRFPPCSAGCGAPRPSRKLSYQVPKMMTWT